MKIIQMIALTVQKIKKCFKKKKCIVELDYKNYDRQNRINHIKFKINTLHIKKELVNLRHNINDIDILLKSMLKSINHSEKELNKSLGEP